MRKCREKNEKGKMKKINNTPFEMLNEAHTLTHTHTQTHRVSPATHTHLHTNLLFVAAGGALHTLLHTAPGRAQNSCVFISKNPPPPFTLYLSPCPGTPLSLSCYSACAQCQKTFILSYLFCSALISFHVRNGN